MLWEIVIPQAGLKGEHLLKARWVCSVHLGIGQNRFSAFGISLLIADICWQVGRHCYQKSDIVLCKRNAKNEALHQITTSSLMMVHSHLSLASEGWYTLYDLRSNLCPGLLEWELPIQRFIFSVGSPWCSLAHEYSFTPLLPTHYLPNQKIQSQRGFSFRLSQRYL